ncbi:hypothetical protein DUI87_10879 [Hirundo rustica rustica]|uniref:Uncharacterized protein n=1 Tax=Hirundo rustica rustica TaxID=333673 RepID=A0A3M0KPW4_HIRRU|nr:hypothetical protein DUI87_10879 [Hirundo rustica rustica]
MDKDVCVLSTFDIINYPSGHKLKLETVSSCSVRCCLKKENNPQLTTATLQEVVECDKVTSESPFLQAKQPQFPQSFLVGLVLQAPHQPRCPPLNTLKHLNVLPKLRGPELDTILKVWPHQCRVQGKNDLPAPAAHTIPDPGQDAIGPPGHLGTLLAQVQLLSPAPPGPFLPGHCPATPSPAYNVAGGYMTQHLDLLNFILLDSAHLSNRSRSFCKVLRPSNRLTHVPSLVSSADFSTNERLSTLVHVVNKNIEQNWPQHRP